MVEGHASGREPPWEAGFEGDRRIVMARLGPFRWIFPRPQRYVPRFHHRVYELAIEEWHLPLETPSLGPWCGLEAALDIRFQATVKFARERAEHLDDLGEHVRACYAPLLRDAAELELAALEAGDWLERDLGGVEHRIADVVHELLALRDIQSRCRCRIDTRFAPPDRLEEHLGQVDPRHEALALELLRRQREAAERLAREHYARQALDQRLRLEHEERLLELSQRETELRHLREAQTTARARAELAAEETRHAERLASELRRGEERLRRDAELRQLELELELREQQLRAEAIGDVEGHLRREIELLAMERQKLALEEEIRDGKLARSRGWLLGAKRRLPPGGDPGGDLPVAGEITRESNPI